MYLSKLIVFAISILSFGACEEEIPIDPYDPGNDPGAKPDTVYYIDSQSEFNSCSKSEFSPGSRIYFAAGKIFNGQFAPTGSGTENNPIKLTAYDSETGQVYWDDIDNKPIINGNGKVNSSFYLYNAENWEINNLEITNTNGSDADQGDLRGIHIVAKDTGTLENITVRNCFVHDVNGKVAGKQRGGIHIHVLGTGMKTRFNNLLIENNYIKDVGGVGIGNQSTWMDIHSDEYHPWTNYVVRGNRVERSGRNAIIIRASRDPVAEYNVLAYPSRYSTGHNIYNFNTEGCIMQYNESYGNTGKLDDTDRGGFDADYNSKNTIIQYNYSHDNHWFLGIMKKYNKGVTVRYNISVNEKLGAYMYGFPTSTGVEDVLIYNNTHFFGAGLNASPIASPAKERIPINTTFYNNIFYFEDSGSWAVSPGQGCVLSNNLFYNVSPKGQNYLTSDPLFENPGTVDFDINMTDPERLSGYRIKSSSPCINAGIKVDNNGDRDFWGNAVGTEATDIGAHEKQ